MSSSHPSVIKEPDYSRRARAITWILEAATLERDSRTKEASSPPRPTTRSPTTAFICPWGKWQYRKMPFGLCNAPAVFQKLMDIVLKDCMSFSCVYIDDILIWSPTWQQHLEDLRHVFGSLRKAGLTCRTEKCEFGKTKLQFLGHYIGNGTLSVPKDRVTAMAEYQRPRIRKQLRSFLGTINYYRKFIPRFHQQSVMLTPAISKAGGIL